jgi:hypothetical protein
LAGTNGQTGPAQHIDTLSTLHVVPVDIGHF